MTASWGPCLFAKCANGCIGHVLSAPVPKGMPRSSPGAGTYRDKAARFTLVAYEDFLRYEIEPPLIYGVASAARSNGAYLEKKREQMRAARAAAREQEELDSA